MSTLLRSSLFSGFDSLTTSLGGKPREILRRFGLPGDLGGNPDQYVLFRKAVALLEYCADYLGCPDFGLRLARQQGIAMLGPVAVLVRNADTVQAAYEAIAQYMHVVGPGIKLTLEPGQPRGAVRLCVSITEKISRTRQMLEMLMGNGNRIACILTGERVHAARMHFPHPRLAAMEVYEAAFGCEVWFEQNACVVEIPVALMRRPVSGADRETASIAAEYLEIHHGRSDASLEDQVRDLVRRILPTGQCNLHVVADALGEHPRALQRRLAESELSLAGIVDDERRQLAELHLSHPNMLLTQVTGLLGYANQSALNRACRRWFGVTPEQLRQSSKTRMS